ncbi:phosphatase PAP2 family protein [Ramlibacter aquaticus]|uniref:Phosphatase PAP2 family protein n=1 Tax=Ramlibacter aquaticus TaxID=2780094 RepID=A0ABR9SEG6_9BURK|nr:bifunctional DedA family/phosphatase PAP2 family protein [Ramlibacter aquaticus]MBE7940127.1 phosphatase PAP2 family protein [Ramlibacter aquaticus]
MGTFVPAALVLFCAGVLVGNGTLGILPTLGVAAIAAIAGDGVSYELGRRAQRTGRLPAITLRHRAWFDKAEALIHRRGAASVLIARFTGAIRAFVPLLAGFAKMSRGRFYFANVFSAVLWAPAHILPGALFGNSLHVAEAVSGRLALLLVLLVVVLWFSAWAVTALRRNLAALAMGLRGRAVAAMSVHDTRWSRVLRRLLDPERSESTAMLGAMVVLLGAAWVFFSVLEDLLTHDSLVRLDLSVFAFLQQLRTQVGDQAMIVFTEAGSVGVLLPLIVLVLAWLCWRRAWRTAAYWVGCAAFGELLVQVLKYTLGRQRPLTLYTGNEQFSFPSGHASVSAVVLGFLAFLVSRGQPSAWRTGAALLAALYVTLVSFSRLYLGAHWLSDVVGGASMGLAWVAVVAMVYTQRGVHDSLAPKGLAGVALLVLATGTLSWHYFRGSADLAFYAVTPKTRALTASAWTQNGWRQLPERRRELAGDGEEPFSVQIACPPDELAQALASAGWTSPPPWDFQSILLTVTGSVASDAAPVLPRFDQGRRADITRVRTGATQDVRGVVRLWRSNVQLVVPSVPTEPIWYGALYSERRDSGKLRDHVTTAPPDALIASARQAGVTQVGSLVPGMPVLLACRIPKS